MLIVNTHILMFILKNCLGSQQAFLILYESLLETLKLTHDLKSDNLCDSDERNLSL